MRKFQTRTRRRGTLEGFRAYNLVTGHLSAMRGYLVLGLIGIGLGILAFLGAVAAMVGIILKALALVLLVLACMAFRRKKTVRAQR